TPEETVNPNLIDGKFELIGEVTAEKDTFALYITGTLKNTTKKTYSYAQVTFNLYDADGNQIGTAFDNINNWEAGGTWKFKAMGMENEAASYKLVEVTAF
ncbi:MAG: FxLYD domain-containing protein, partial [Oscillospiraceae bacterium]|nr:FxLYD domain-containing protein [Oscillospiraceae bacterium]